MSSDAAPPELRSSAVLRRPEQVRFRILDGEGVVIRRQEGEVLVLNGVGARIFDLLDGRRSVARLLELLEAEYDAARDTLERDVLAYLDELLEAGLAEPAGPASEDPAPEAPASESPPP